MNALFPFTINMYIYICHIHIYICKGWRKIYIYILFHNTCNDIKIISFYLRNPISLITQPDINNNSSPAFVSASRDRTVGRSSRLGIEHIGEKLLLRSLAGRFGKRANDGTTKSARDVRRLGDVVFRPVSNRRRLQRVTAWTHLRVYGYAYLALVS